MTTHDLGPLVGGRFHQYTSAVGQSYYVDTTAKTTSYSIPVGFEDHAQVSLFCFQTPLQCIVILTLTNNHEPGSLGTRSVQVLAAMVSLAVYVLETVLSNAIQE